MRLLLDTQIALWALTASKRLGKTAGDLIENPANEVFVSTATVWEIAIKHALGVAGFFARAQVFHHLIGLQNIGADLVAPACIALAFMRRVDRRVALIQLQLIEPRAQRVHRDFAVLVL